MIDSNDVASAVRVIISGIIYLLVLLDADISRDPR